MKKTVTAISYSTFKLKRCYKIYDKIVVAYDYIVGEFVEYMWREPPTTIWRYFTAPCDLFTDDKILVGYGLMKADGGPVILSVERDEEIIYSYLGLPDEPTIDDVYTPVF